MHVSISGYSFLVLNHLRRGKSGGSCAQFGIGARDNLQEVGDSVHCRNAAVDLIGHAVRAAQAPPVKLAGVSNFSATVIHVGRSPGPVSIGKLTCGGHQDIVVGNYDDGTVSVLPGRR